MAAGVAFSLVVGCGLMALVFYSNRHGYDEPYRLDEDETLAFVANSVVVGSTVVMPSCPPRVGRQLEAWGFEVVVSPIREFLKAGGGCRCLTLALDVRLG